jgi:hypothetical protein
MGPPGINGRDWEVYHRRVRITVSSRCPDIFDQPVSILGSYYEAGIAQSVLATGYGLDD